MCLYISYVYINACCYKMDNMDIEFVCKSSMSMWYGSRRIWQSTQVKDSRVFVIPRDLYMTVDSIC